MTSEVPVGSVFYYAMVSPGTLLNGLRMIVPGHKSHVCSHHHHIHEALKEDSVQWFCCCACGLLYQIREVTPGRQLNKSEQAEHPTHHWHRKETAAGTIIPFSCCGCNTEIEVNLVNNPLFRVLAPLSRADDFDAITALLKRVLQDLFDTPAMRRNKLKKTSTHLSRPGAQEALKALGYVETDGGEMLQLPEKLLDDFSGALEPQLRAASACVNYFDQMLALQARGEKPTKAEEEGPICDRLGVFTDTNAEVLDTLGPAGTKLALDHYYTLGVLPNDRDEVIRMVVRCLMRDRPHKMRVVRDSVLKIAEKRTSRDSQLLKHEIKERFELLDSTAIVLEQLGLNVDADDPVVAQRMVAKILAEPDLRPTLVEMAQVLLNARQTVGMQKMMYEIKEKLDALTPRNPVDPARFTRGAELRFRGPGEPAGLVNFNNLCYFNSLMQVYFCLPELRRLVFQYDGPVPREVPKQREAVPNLFALELRLLFAFMAQSHRAVLNGEGAADSMLLAGSAVMGQQQDITEVNGSILELLSAATAQASPQLNETFKKLFQGTKMQVMTPKEGSAQPTVMKSEFVGADAYLDVAAGELYRALEQYTADVEVSTDSGLYLKRTLFESLPQVLFLPIQRTSYDPRTQQAVRRADRFSFPLQLRMGRFLYANRDAADQARAKVADMQHKLVRCEKAIAEYSQTLTNMSIDVLLTTASASVMSLDLLPESESVKLTGLLSGAAETASAQLAKLHKGHNGFTAGIASAFDHLPQQADYALHAVMCHDGNVRQGHYIVFVRGGEKGWTRFNDTSVTAVTEEDMFREATGGEERSRAAYCLVYTAGNADPRSGYDTAAQDLPIDLIDTVGIDNAKVLQEMNLA